MIFSSYGQNLPAKLEKGLVNYNYDSTFALIQKGKKSGLYNLRSSELEIPFDKRGKLLAELGSEFYLIDEEKATKYSAANGVLKELCDSKNDTTEDCWEISKTANGQFIVNLFEVPVNWVGDEYGKDLVSDYSKCIQSTGVINPNTMEWVLPNKFMKVFTFQNMLFAIRLDSEYIDLENPSRYAYSYTYHVFQEVKGKYEAIKTISKFDDADVVEFFGLDSIRKTESHEQLYYAYKDGKVGVLYHDLNYQYLFHDYHLRLEEVIPIEYDYLQFIGKTALAASTKDKRMAHQYHFTHDNGFVRAKKAATAVVQDDYFKFGLEIINDSLIKIIDVDRGKLEPISSVLYPDEDSINENGYTLYDRIEVVQNTGIYNTRSHSWLLPANYWNGYFAGDKFIVHEMFLDESNSGHLRANFAILDLELTTLKSGLERAQFYNNPAYFKQLFADQQYQEMRKWGGYTEGEKSADDQPIFQGIRPNGKMDLLAPNEGDFDPSSLIENVDFAIVDPRSESLFYIKNDSIYCQFRDTIRSVSTQDGELAFMMSCTGRNCEYSVVTSNSDSLVWTKGACEIRTTLEAYNVQIDFEFRGDYLILRYSPTLFSSMIDEIYGESWGTKSEDLEYSAIWERTDDGFEQVTASYADLTTIPNGFIAVTFENTGDLTFDEYGEVLLDSVFDLLLENVIEPRYILLNSEFNAIQLLDHYDFEMIEDLEYGLSVSTKRGRMFITYDWKIITTDEWEEFSIEKGRLRAFHSGLIRDENGDPRLDDTGEYMYAKEPITQYFDLPK